MRGLILQLANLDSEAEAKIRVIDFFDTLLRNHATLDDVLRSTAGLSGTFVGIRLMGSNEEIAYNGSGEILPSEIRERIFSSSPPGKRHVTRTSIVHNGRKVAEVWLADMDDEASSLHTFIVERLSLACEVLWAADAFGEESRALMRLLDGELPLGDRRKVLESFGRQFPHRVHVVVIRPSSIPPVSDWAKHRVDKLCLELGRAKRDLYVHRKEHEIIVCLEPELATLMRTYGDTITVGPLVDAIQASDSYTLAIRLADYIQKTTITRDHVFFYDDWGPFSTFDFNTDSSLRRDPKIQAVLHTLDTKPNYAKILHVYLKAGNLRDAGKKLHMHHSSVATHLSHFKTMSGNRLQTPLELSSALLALMLWLSQPK